jgi:hypothetical protein
MLDRSQADRYFGRMSKSKHEKVRVLVIDSKNQCVKEVFLCAGATLEGLQEAVGGYIERVPTQPLGGKRYDLYVNEEGLYQGFDAGFVWCGFMQPLVGNGVLAGVDSRGNTIDCPLTVKEVEDNVMWLTLADSDSDSSAAADSGVA